MEGFILFKAKNRKKTPCRIGFTIGIVTVGMFFLFFTLEGFDTRRVVGGLAQICREACLPGSLGKFANKDDSPKSFQGVNFCFCQK